MTRIHASIAGGALVVAVMTAAGAEWAARRADISARLSFDEITFDLPPADTRAGGPLTPLEAAMVVSVARSEVDLAFAGMRIAFADNPRAAYQVLVSRDLPLRPGPRPLAAAESVALGPLGGRGWVSFQAIASLAVSHAPAGAGRAAIVDGIGRGIGRVAAHEFAHQILAGADLHVSEDAGSYEYASADRAAQFYRPMHWDFASPLLARKLGVSD